MGKIKQGILGGFSGKVANVVGSSWKGIAVIKSLPLSVANPKTAGQVAQRAKMTNVVEFSKEILASIIKPLRDRFAVQQSGYNTFVSDNIALFAASLPSPAADLVIAEGKMAKTAFATLVVADSDATVTATWVDDSGEGFKLAADEVYIVATNDLEESIGFDAASVIRSDESVSFEMPSVNNSGDSVSAYLVFMRADGTVVSDTSYKIEVVA